MIPQIGKRNPEGVSFYNPNPRKEEGKESRIPSPSQKQPLLSSPASLQNRVAPIVNEELFKEQLFEAIDEGKLDSLKKLLRPGVCLNKLRSGGESVVHVVVISRHFFLLSHLVEFQPDLKLDQLNDDGMTPLEFAKYLDIDSLLFAEIKKIYSSALEKMQDGLLSQILKMYPQLFYVPDRKGQTVSQKAACRLDPSFFYSLSKYHTKQDQFYSDLKLRLRYALHHHQISEVANILTKYPLEIEADFPNKYLATLCLVFPELASKVDATKLQQGKTEIKDSRNYDKWDLFG